MLYFLHPTVVVPFNTAIVNGYNALTGSKVKLGRWDEYLAMREGVLRLNSDHRDLLSNDLGAAAGFLFDIGSQRYPLPPTDDDAAAEDAWRADLARVREESAKERKAVEAGREQDRTHTEVQGWLRDLGRALGFDVWVATNDRARHLGNGRLADGCLEELPDPLVQVDSVPLIDVIWLDRGTTRAAAAFEVEHTTSIYSGIVRLLDLASAPAQTITGLYLVAPDAREEDVRKQLARPAFRRIGSLSVKYLPYGELERNRESMARFGSGLKAVDAVARALS
jgi:type II restriction enzyme